MTNPCQLSEPLSQHDSSKHMGWGSHTKICYNKTSIWRVNSAHEWKICRIFPMNEPAKDMLQVLLTFNRWHAVCKTTVETLSHFFLRIWLAPLCCCQYFTFCLIIYLYFLPFVSHLIWSALQSLVWQRSQRLHATGCMTVFDLAALIYTKQEQEHLAISVLQ